MRRVRMTAIILCGTLALPAISQAAELFSGEISLVLEKAMYAQRGEDAATPHLIVELKCNAGQWDRAWCIALGYNNSVGYGLVRKATVEGKFVRLGVDANQGNDLWTRGGHGGYSVELTGDDNGQLKGQYEGEFRGRKVKGTATGELRPLRPILIKDYKPIGYGEHPRLLFRKSDVPVLKERLKTPLGQAYLQAARQSKDPKAPDLVSVGMLYQLTGDKACADEAMKTIQSFNGDVDPNPSGSGSAGHRLVQTALAFDLCYDAWTAELREQVAADMLKAIQFTHRRLRPGHANYHPCSNYYGPCHGSIGIAGLAIWGEKGPMPPEPKEPPPVAASAPASGPAITAEEAAQLTADARAVWRFDHEIWELDRKAWEASGGVDPVKIFNAGLSRFRINLHYRLGMGDGGFQAETGSYSLIGGWYPLVYAGMHRTMFGWDVSTRPDVSHVMPRRMMQVIFSADGKQQVQKINSVVGFDVAWVAAAWPILPDPYKPSLLWGWNQTLAVKDAGSVASIAGTKGTFGSGLSSAQAFINYPLDLKPVHPEQGMPLNWEAKDFGYYCARSGWGGKDEFVGQVFLKAKPVMGWNHGNAGTFRLLGLGHEWVTGSNERNGARPQEPVVIFREDELSDGGCGRLTYYKTQKDGSASMTIDMAEVYSKSTGLYDRNLIRWPENFKESGVKGLRAIVFDYSGKSGAPCLMVLVDKIEGGKKKEWLWQIPADLVGRAPSKGAPRTGAKPTAGAKGASVDGNAFVLDYGDATLRGTFIAPQKPTLDAGSEQIQYQDPRHGYHGPIDRVKATGGDSFFVVVTVQRGPAPQVNVEGAGLDARITVGKQQIRFDGQKIVLE